MPPSARQHSVTRPTRSRAHLGLGLLGLLLGVLPNLCCLLAALLLRRAWPLGHLALDLRSLALARVGLGLTLLEDLRQRASDLAEFYTDEGVCPRHVSLHPHGGPRPPAPAKRRAATGAGAAAGAAAAGTAAAGAAASFPKNPRMHPDDFSLYSGVGSAAGVGCLFALAVAAAAALTLGWHTGAAAAACYVHVRSVEARNGVVHQAGDTLLRAVLGWAVLLPMGARWSLDAAGWGTEAEAAAAAARAPAANAHLSAASAGWLLQLALLYCFTAMFKIDAAWADGRAVRFTCSNFAFARQPAAGWLLRCPPLVRLLTKATVWIEASAPALVLWALPFGCAARALGALVFVGFHCSLHATMYLGIFPLACVAAWVGTVPGCVWDALLGSVAAEAGGCSSGGSGGDGGDDGWGAVLAELPRFSLAVLLSALACRANLANLAGVREFAAATAAAKGEVPPSEPPAPARGALAERARAAQRCLILPPAPLTSHPLEARCRQLLRDAVTACVASAAAATPAEQRLARALGQNQQWFLFDQPARKSFLFLVQGTTAGGATVDLLHPPPPGCSAQEALAPARPWQQGPLSWEHAFRNNRWRKWLHRIGEAKYLGYRAAFASFLAERWQAAALAAGVAPGDARVDEVTVSMCAKLNPPWTDEEIAAGLGSEAAEGGARGGAEDEGGERKVPELDTEAWHLGQLWQWARPGFAPPAAGASGSPTRKKQV